MTFRVHSLADLDPDVDLDDLEPLRELIGSARVVALGENAHFIREFALLRNRLLRFLVGPCRFSALAYESGFSEGFALDDWLQGRRPEGDLPALAEECIPSGLARPAEVRDMFRWLRTHTSARPSGVRFTGIDVPTAAGSLLPSLLPLTGYLDRVDPDARTLLDPAVDIATDIAGTTQAQSAALAAAGVGLGLADLRPARGADGGPDRIRLDSDYLTTPVVDAFDAVVHVPESHAAADLGW